MHTHRHRCARWWCLEHEIENSFVFLLFRLFSIPTVSRAHSTHNEEEGRKENEKNECDTPQFKNNRLQYHYTHSKSHTYANVVQQTRMQCITNTDRHGRADEQENDTQKKYRVKDDEEENTDGVSLLFPPRLTTQWIRTNERTNEKIK